MKHIDPEAEKAVRGSKGLLEFCDHFGRDIYTQILLEVLLEGVMNEEAVFILGEQEQAGSEVGDSSSGGEPSGIEAGGLDESQAPADMGKKDLPDYP